MLVGVVYRSKLSALKALSYNEDKDAYLGEWII